MEKSIKDIKISRNSDISTTETLEYLLSELSDYQETLEKMVIISKANPEISNYDMFLEFDESLNDSDEEITMPNRGSSKSRGKKRCSEEFSIEDNMETPDHAVDGLQDHKSNNASINACKMSFKNVGFIIEKPCKLSDMTNPINQEPSDAFSSDVVNWYTSNKSSHISEASISYEVNKYLKKRFETRNAFNNDSKIQFKNVNLNIGKPWNISGVMNLINQVTLNKFSSDNVDSDISNTSNDTSEATTFSNNRKCLNKGCDTDTCDTDENESSDCDSETLVIANKFSENNSQALTIANKYAECDLKTTINLENSDKDSAASSMMFSDLLSSVIDKQHCLDVNFKNGNSQISTTSTNFLQYPTQVPASFKTSQKNGHGFESTFTPSDGQENISDDSVFGINQNPQRVLKFSDSSSDSFSDSDQESIPEKRATDPLQTLTELRDQMNSVYRSPQFQEEDFVESLHDIEHSLRNIESISNTSHKTMTQVSTDSNHKYKKIKLNEEIVSSDRPAESLESFLEGIEPPTKSPTRSDSETHREPSVFLPKYRSKTIAEYQRSPVKRTKYESYLYHLAEFKSLYPQHFHVNTNSNRGSPVRLFDRRKRDRGISIGCTDTKDNHQEIFIGCSDTRNNNRGISIGCDETRDSDRRTSTASDETRDSNRRTSTASDETRDSDRSSTASDETRENGSDTIVDIFKTVIKFHPIKKFEIPPYAERMLGTTGIKLKDSCSKHTRNNPQLNGINGPENVLKECSNVDSNSLMLFEVFHCFGLNSCMICDGLINEYLKISAKVNLLLIKPVRCISVEEYDLRMLNLCTLEDKLRFFTEKLMTIMNNPSKQFKELFRNENVTKSNIDGRRLYRTGTLKISLQLVKILVNFSNELKLNLEVYKKEIYFYPLSN